MMKNNELVIKLDTRRIGGLEMLGVGLAKCPIDTRRIGGLENSSFFI